MSVKVINAYNTIDPETESHYAYYTTVFNTAQYPQVHDFYEIDLVTDGSLQFTMGERILNLPVGSLLWVRPGDVHSKALPEKGAHINLAFPAGAVSNLFEFLYDKKTYDTMMNRPYCPPGGIKPGRVRIPAAENDQPEPDTAGQENPNTYPAPAAAGGNDQLLLYRGVPQ
ncbi:MAG: AraC family ligand binding domain-containing protein [Treponema sp.]|jgi:hypothetical protein|nr:AraC family ligand binding domain-containing protein [Treponema sp.]